MINLVSSTLYFPIFLKYFCTRILVTLAFYFFPARESHILTVPSLPPFPFLPCSSLTSFPPRQRCLVVRHDLRYTVDQALLDPFFNIDPDYPQRKPANAQLERDLKELEEKNGQKWLTCYQQLNDYEERCVGARMHAGAVRGGAVRCQRGEGKGSVTAGLPA